MFRKLTSYTILVAILVALIVPSGSTQARQRVTITWFIGLGTGTGLEQIETQNAVADAFNESHDQINLVLHFAPATRSRLMFSQR